MASLCITYLCLCQQDRRSSKEGRQGYQCVSTGDLVIQLSTPKEQNEFFEYCAEHWTSHLREDAITKDSEILDQVLLLYTTNTDRFHA